MKKIICFLIAFTSLTVSAQNTPVFNGKQMIHLARVSPWLFSSRPAGWYRIAKITGGARANASFEIREGADHSTLRFEMGINYNSSAGSSFTLTNHSYYLAPTFTRIRLLSEDVYADTFLEIYVEPHNNDGQNFDAYLLNPLAEGDWELINWTIGEIPAGYTVTEYDTNKLFSVGNNPNGNIFSVGRNGNVGVGSNASNYKLQIAGGHSTTNMNLHYHHLDPTLQADLTLWASEPAWTYTGAGIGNNVFNSPTSGVIRINNSKGGSYIRLLDQEIKFNVLKSDGTDISTMTLDATGNVGIGITETKGYKLAVAGNMVAESVKVKLKDTWPDYVFSKSYALPTLQQTEQHIKEKGHLPGIPSAAEVKANGIDLGEMNAKLLQKIEELTLHLINKEKEIKNLKGKIEQQDKKIDIILNKIKNLP